MEKNWSRITNITIKNTMTEFIVGVIAGVVVSLISVFVGFIVGHVTLYRKIEIVEKAEKKLKQATRRQAVYVSTMTPKEKKEADGQSMRKMLDLAPSSSEDESE